MEIWLGYSLTSRQAQGKSLHEPYFLEVPQAGSTAGWKYRRLLRTDRFGSANTPKQPVLCRPSPQHLPEALDRVQLRLCDDSR